ncbi:hypothetical protein AVM02_15615 [Brucella anthropi]|uniref:hypothetical protein n=1 Tax=Brucella anthropi TaxID=529 RepID=UPI0039860914
MIGATLSRWTLSYFTASLVFLVFALGLMASGFGFPGHGIRAPETLIIVHAVAIGWLALLMSGALLQFVPVLVNRALWGSRGSLPALLLLVAGLSGLLAGFAGMAGLIESPAWLLPASGILLAGGFSIIFAILGMTLWLARPVALPARFVAAGICCLLVTALLGTIFTFALSGFTEDTVLLDIAGAALPAHAALGLGGWMTFTAMGVSYRLLTMFMLSPDAVRRTTGIIWWEGAAALTILAAGVVVVALDMGSMEIAVTAALIPGIACIALYIVDIRTIYRQRKRKTIELNSAASIPAFIALGLSLVLAIALSLTGATDPMIGGLVYLFTFGWLTGLSLAQLYKIIPFLTWLECYGPVMGRAPTPRVQDMVSERRARQWFALYYTGVALATLALIAGYPAAFRLAAILNLAAILALIIHFFRARRLLDVPDGIRLPKGATRPHLIYAGEPIIRRSK